MKISFREGANGDQDALSHSGKKRLSKRSILGKDPAVQKDIENKESMEKCENNILHRLERIEGNEKVITYNYFK